MASDSDGGVPDQVETRAAHLLPEEEAAGGSDDARRQAELILEDSEIRSLDRDRAPDSYVEHRTSDEATEPVEGAPELS